MNELNKNDYIIKPCSTCSNIVKPIDIDRIRKKLDSNFAKKDFDEVDRLLKYWISEAKNANNLRSELELQNEYMGFCRKMGRCNDAIKCAERASEIIEELHIEDTISGATIYVNIATVYKAFDKTDTAMTYFEKAKDTYEKDAGIEEKLLASLYNNMALALVDLKKFNEADSTYKKAIDIMSKVKDGELDLAISYLNYADLVYAKSKLDKNDNYAIYESEISKCVEKAWNLFNLESTPRDDYYKFVCEKSVNTFEFYGYFRYAEELKKRM